MLLGILTFAGILVMLEGIHLHFDADETTYHRLQRDVFAARIPPLMS